jgi:type IV pilus assembly protein PilO
MATAAEQFVERVTKLPPLQRAAIMVAIAALITSGNYFGLVQGMQDEIDGAVREMRAEEERWIKNKGIAGGLGEYRKQKELLEQRLAAALKQMPEEANIDGLVSSFYELGTKSGLEITSLEPKGEIRGAFYAEIPMALTVAGNYHDIAVFFDSVGRMERIVNISGIKLSNPRTKNEKVLVDSSFTATTFRFLPTPAGAK